MIRLPNPTAREVRWSFIVVFACAVALTATISWGVVHKVNQSDQIVRIAASSADQVERLNAQLDAQAKIAEVQRADLQRQNRLTRAQLRALLRYLRAHGIQVPQTALTPPEHGTVTRPKGTGPQGPAPTPRPPVPPSPLPGSPTPTGPPSPTPSPSLAGSLCDLLRLNPCPLH